MNMKFLEKPWKYPYYVRATNAGKVTYHMAFKRKRDAQSAAKDLRSMRNFSTAAKPFRVSVIKRKRKRKW